MKLVERHIITKENYYWKPLDNICFLSKNLYNSALYLNILRKVSPDKEQEIIQTLRCRDQAIWSLKTSL